MDVLWPLAQLGAVEALDAVSAQDTVVVLRPLLSWDVLWPSPPKQQRPVSS